MNEAVVLFIAAIGIVVTILMYLGGIAESNRRA
jgi:hypothetical protein